MSYRGLFVAQLLLLFLFLPGIMQARHIIGGEITYECLGEASPGNNRYRFTMVIYRDCDGNGAWFDDPANFAIYRGSYNVNTFYQSFQVNLTEWTNIVPDTPECVRNFPPVCVERGVYIFEQVLPILANESYFMVYQRCCRNNSITNLISPGDVGATYMIELTPAAQQLCNDSPTFKNYPSIVICKDIPLEFDHSAIDSDGDFLVYRFCSPFDGGGPLLTPPALNSCDGAMPIPPCSPPFNNVPFVVPAFSPGSPMGGSPVIDIDGATGIITGTPNIVGQFVVGVCVEEYRNGTLLSTLRRDFQFNVADCDPTVLAKIEAPDTLISVDTFTLKICGTKSVVINNESLDLNFINNFEWRINLNNGNELINTTNWDQLPITFPDTGTYRGTLILNPQDECSDTAHLVIHIFPEINADFSYDYDTCVAGPVVFTDLSTGLGIINQWKWDFGVPGGTSDIPSPEYQYAIPGDHPVRLTVIDRNGCQSTIEKTINWFPAPPYVIIQPSSYIGCKPAEIFFNNLSSPIDETYEVVWDFGDGTVESGVISPTHTYDTEGFYTVSVSITSPIGCKVSDTFVRLIRVEPSPIADFEYQPDTLISILNSTVQFIDKSSEVAHWNWTFDRYGTSLEQNPTFTFPDTGLQKIRLIVTHPEGCKDSLTKVLDIIPEIRWYMPNAFSPNGDGVNDGFLGKGYLEGATNFKMTVWNRWGELVFETTSPTEDWNGRAQNTGGWSPAGVYVYLVSFTGPRGQLYEYRGFATLVR